MKLEIKQRIEQIKAGQVPDGYKRTRAGIMPYDWCCDREYRAKDIFKSITNKKHNSEFDVLSATQDKGVIPREQVDINIKYNKDSVAGYKKVDKGDFVISLRSFQGGIEYSEYEGLVSPAYTVLKPIIPICDEYYKYYFKTSDYINRLNIGTYGIRDGKQIGYEDFGDMVIHYPPLAEQEKVAKILSTQNRIIELYQRKIEELQKMKNVYLSKMFPKKGESVPEWRFPQFTGAWEQRKLGGDIVNIHTGTNLLGSESNSGLPLIKMGNIQRGYFNISKLEYLAEGEYPEEEDIVSYGDFFFNTRNTLELVGKGATWMGASGKYAFNSNIARLELKNVDTIFFNYLYNTEDMTKQIHVRATGTTSVAAIYPQTLESVEYCVPTMKEQRMIGSSFHTLDNLITLHQRKLEETKKYKKALMQLLLTGIVRCK